MLADFVPLPNEYSGKTRASSFPPQLQVQGLGPVNSLWLTHSLLFPKVGEQRVPPPFKLEPILK